MDYYTMVTPCCDGVPCNKEDYEQVKEVLEKERCGFEAALHESQHSPTGWLLYLYAEQSFVLEEMKQSLPMIGEIIKRAGLPHLEFGYAHYGSKPRANTAHGGRFRIYPDGTVRIAEFYWPLKATPI